MPQETFLELAAWYHGLGRLAESERALELAPPNAEVLYWLARVKDERGDSGASAVLLKADAASPELVFPFRPESAEVLAWAASKSASWRPRYYQALVQADAGNVDEARRFFEACGETPDYAPFYAARSVAFESASPEKAMADLERAARLDPPQWRFGRMLAERQLRRGAPAAALETARAYSARFPENYILGMLHAKALLANGRHRESAAKLAGLRVIAYEGSIEGRRLYRETHLMLAVEALKRKDATAARREVDAARLWPENLGAGKPYPADVDERLEDFLAAQGLAQRGRTEDASTLLQQVAGFTGRQRERGAGTLVHALSLKQAGRDAEGQKLLAEWTARDPAGALVAWAARAYVGDVGPLPDGAGEEARVLAAWLAPRSPGSVSE
jgi:tetratricopeptide (TPR) repeat protein